LWAQAARRRINEWVREQTETKIPELIAPGLLDSSTRMVLTNAIYFKATWSEPFERLATRDEPFFAPGGPVTTPLMRRVAHVRVGAIDGGQIAELPYASGELVMDVVLPAGREGLPALEDELATGALPRWLERLGPARTDLMLPRFMTGSAFSLAGTLAAMGLDAAFRYPAADFSGMDDTRELYIGSVIHQALVDVDESGTEAAAATAVAMFAGCAPGRPARLVPRRSPVPVPHPRHEVGRGPVRRKAGRSDEALAPAGPPAYFSPFGFITYAPGAGRATRANHNGRRRLPGPGAGRANPTHFL
jgi:serpin B